MSALLDFHVGHLSLQTGIYSVGFCGGRTTGEPEEKPQNEARTNNKRNSHMTLGWNRTCTTLVGGKCSQHCTIPTPPHLIRWTKWQTQPPAPT